MNINEAINYYNQAQKEHTKAEEAAKAAQEKSRNLWDVLRTNKASFKEWKTAPEYSAAKEADEIEAAARAAANIAQAIAFVASYNVLEVARNTIYNEVTAAPEKYNKPVHFKVMHERLNSICGDDFNIYTSYSTVYLRYRAAAGTNEIFLFDLDNENKINFDRPYIQKRAPELTLKEIKKEVKQAVKDAAKLRAAAEELYNKSEAMQNSYKSYIKHYMPRANKYFLDDNYRLF